MKQLYILASFGVIFLIASCKKEGKIDQPPLYLKAITLSTDTINLLVGAHANFTATLVPSNAIDTALSFTSLDNTIATVKKPGQVTGVSPGTTYIDVANTSGTVDKQLVVNVLPVEPTQLTLNDDSVTMLLGTIDTLTAKLLPANTTYKTVYWNTSNSEFVGVNPIDDSHAAINARGVGTVTIRANSQDATKSASCKVVVRDMNSFLFGIGNYLMVTNANGGSENTSFSLTNNSKYVINITEWDFYGSNGQALSGQQFQAGKENIAPMGVYNSFTIGVSLANFGLPDKLQEFTIYIYFNCKGINYQMKLSTVNGIRQQQVVTYH